MFVLGALAGLVGLFYWWMMKPYNHWKKKGIIYPKPIFLYGNMKEVKNTKISKREFMRKIYVDGEGHKYIGIFDGRIPLLFIRDPDLIKKIVQRDYDHFTERAFSVVGIHNTILEKMMLFSRGDNWRKIRQACSPAFTASKVNSLIGSMDLSATNIINSIHEQIKINGTPEIDLLPKTNKYTVDISAKINFGIEFLEKNDAFVYSVCGLWKRWLPIKKLHQFAIQLDLPDWLASRVPFSLHCPESWNKIHEIFRVVIDYRIQNKIRSNDIIQFLLDAKSQEKNNLVDEETTLANLFLFFWAVFESSSTFLAVTLHSLATNPKVQTKLREEVVKELAASKGQLTHEALANMPYLKMVVLEALRLFPTFSDQSRTCTKRYQLDDNLWLEPGDRVTYSAIGLHTDPKYYKEPEKFMPERFAENEISKRPPFTFFPFGGGPKLCIGYRIAMTQAKVLLARFVSTFVIEPSENTSKLDFVCFGDALILEKPLYLSFKPVDVSF